MADIEVRPPQLVNFENREGTDKQLSYNDRITQDIGRNFDGKQTYYLTAIDKLIPDGFAIGDNTHYFVEDDGSVTLVTNDNENRVGFMDQDVAFNWAVKTLLSVKKEILNDRLDSLTKSNPKRGRLFYSLPDLAMPLCIFLAAKNALPNDLSIMSYLIQGGGYNTLDSVVFRSLKMYDLMTKCSDKNISRQVLNLLPATILSVISFDDGKIIKLQDGRLRRKFFIRKNIQLGVLDISQDLEYFAVNKTKLPIKKQKIDENEMDNDDTFNDDISKIDF